MTTDRLIVRSGILWVEKKLGLNLGNPNARPRCDFVLRNPNGNDLSIVVPDIPCDYAEIGDRFTVDVQPYVHDEAAES